MDAIYKEDPFPLPNLDSFNAPADFLTKETALELLYAIYNKYINSTLSDIGILYDYRAELTEKGLDSKIAGDYLWKYHQKLSEIPVIAKDEDFLSYSRKITELAKGIQPPQPEMEMKQYSFLKKQKNNQKSNTFKENEFRHKRRST